MRKKFLTDAILLALEKSIDGYIKFEDFTYNPHKYLYGYPRIIKKSLLSQALKRLRENGLIDFTDEGKLLLKLTDKGLDKAIWAKLKTDDKSKWNGKWTLVSFDIPEKRKAARNLLRFRLKEWGFMPWQKSLWASKKDCIDPLRKYIKHLGIKDWVMVIESNNVDV